MKCAYEAANGVEAHMIANLLEQVGVATRIDGEHLSSGVGELPAAGLVRVMVEPHQYDRAREVIREWERTATPESAAPKRPRSLGAVWFVLGAGVAVAVMAWINRPEFVDAESVMNGRAGVVRVDEQGRFKTLDIDWDGDGRIDRQERYFGGVLSTVTMFAPNGQVVKREYYQRGVLSHAEYDSTGDGALDTRYRYDRYGEVVEVTRD
jgi:hypothetical protein